MGGEFSLKKIFLPFFRRRASWKQGESESCNSLWRVLSYRFRDETLLKNALTHRSSLAPMSGQRISNERLEFLGDAVLGLVVTDELYRRFPEWSEGELSKAKSYLVSRDMLAQQAKKLGVGDYLVLGNGEEKSGGRSRKSILSDAYEALLGAIYLDGGVEEARRFIRRHLLKNVHRMVQDKQYRNYKSLLLEYFQGEEKRKPEYRVLSERGPDHRKEFVVEVRIGNRVLGKGKGYSKKGAEQDAARQAVQRLGLEF